MLIYKVYCRYIPNILKKAFIIQEIKRFLNIKYK